MTSLELTSISSRHDKYEVHLMMCDCLLYAIPHMENLTKLNLSRTRFTDKIIEPLCGILNKATNVTDLNLSCIALTSEGLRKLADDYLSSNPRKLKTLNLSQNKFTDNIE